MFTVSNDYEMQMRKQTRNLSYMRVYFTIVDPQAIGYSTLIDNGHTYFSKLSDIELNKNIQGTYSTFELDRFKLDGSQEIAKDIGYADYIYQGFVSSEVSDEFGVYNANPKITIDFGTNYLSFIGLTMTFDSITKDYPSELQIIAYKDSIEVFNSILNPTKSIDYLIEQNIPEHNVIEIIPLKSNKPYRRFRLENLLFGLKKSFESDVLQKSTLTKEIDLISSKLPTFKFDFTFLDINREYDPENAIGVYKYMEAEQSVIFEYGYELDNGDIEWVRGGNTFTNGDIKVDNNASIPMVELKTTSRLALLKEVYNRGVYTGTPRTLYELATEVLTYANIPLDSQGNKAWYVDEVLKDYTTLIPLPKQPINVLLQLIANAGMCIIVIDRNGHIILKPLDTTLQDFKYTFADIKSPPLVNKYPELQGVDTSVFTINVDSNLTELGKFEITNANNTLYEFQYPMATNITSSLGSGLSIIGSPTYYANGCSMVLSGDGSILINGNKITTIKNNIAVEFNVNGERCPIENSLITDYSHAIDYTNWIGNYISRRNEYTIEDRGFPEIDTGDKIKLDTLYNESVEVNILSSKINYNGAISGNTKLLM